MTATWLRETSGGPFTNKEVPSAGDVKLLLEGAPPPPPPGQKPMMPPGQPPPPPDPGVVIGALPVGRLEKSGPPPPPDPEAAISTLPKALQPEFKQALDAKHQAHIGHTKAELEMLKRIRKTLEAVKNYLPKANDNGNDMDAGPRGRP